MKQVKLKTIKQYLSQVAVGMAITSTLAWFLNQQPLDLHFSNRLLIRVLVGSGLGWLLINIDSIFQKIRSFFRTTLDTPQKRKKFVWLNLANLALTALVIIAYTLFRYGSPLVFEETHQASGDKRTVWLVNDQIVKQEFTASSDNLGTIGLKFGVKETRLVEDEGEIRKITDLELEEEDQELSESLEEFESEDDSNQDEAEFGPEETEEKNEEGLEEQTQAEEKELEPVKLEFRIKEKGADDWLAVNQYHFDKEKPFGYYPLGFPVIEDSEGKDYVFEIESNHQIKEIDGEGIFSENENAVEEKSLVLAAFVKANENSQTSFYERFVYSKNDLVQDYSLILNNFQRKLVKTFFSYQFFLPLIIHFALSSTLIISFSMNQRFNEAATLIFLGCLFLVSTTPFIEEYYQSTLLINFYKIYLFLCTISLGTCVLSKNQKYFEKKVKSLKNRENKLQSKKIEQLKNKFPRINKLPLLGAVSKLIYKNGVWYFLTLFLTYLIFLGIRLYMFRFKGNYPDEYFHLLSGIHLFKEGELPKLVRYTKTWQYTRGSHISFLAGLFMYLLGQSLIVAKLVPITLGCLNFFMMVYICKSIIINKFVRIVYLLIYSVLSWSIFNHFYIRGYVFTEFSFILLLFLSLIMLELIKKGKTFYKVLVVYALVALITFINYYFSNDQSALIIPLAFLFDSFYLFYEAVLKKYKNKLLNIGTIIAVSTLTFINANFIRSKIRILLHRSSNTGANHINFNQFFFDINFIFSILAILAFIHCLLSKNPKKKLLLVTLLPLLGLHAISNVDLQVMRGMMYIFPAYFFSSMIFLDLLPKIKTRMAAKTALVVLLMSFMLVLKTNYDLVFSRGYPSIPSEIGYHEYSKQYDYLKQNTGNYITFAAVYNSQRQEFFDFEYNYKISFTHDLSQGYSHYVNKKNIVKQLYTNTPVISDFKQFKNMIERKKSCIILKPYSKDHFLGEKPYNFIIANFELVDEGIGYQIFCNYTNSLYK